MNLPASFREYGEAILARHSEIVHEWHIKSAFCSLSVPAQSTKGFNIQFDIELDSVTLYWGNWHTRIEPTVSIDKLIEDLFGLLRDMLSPEMRVRELYAGRKPYRGFLESYDGGQWSTEHEMCLVFWNYCGRRSVKTYSNAILPGRASKANLVDKI